ncbi:hypothetical protein [uncultured Alistipes sp.]|uniref:hypothetical protein n=1 Tax=uncultured Alistipes sp. TaxID=538949 RepID=UPI00266FAB20|nr:hypothetical protein [uncultured Alistipes sp.]
MRTIDQIKESIAADFMNNEAVADLFGFPAGDNFAAHFSKVSVVNLLFYVFASAAWVVERLFETHRAEIEARIGEIIPHRAKWYKSKVLEFMQDRTLMPDTDRYDTSGMTQEEVDAARVVKYVTADENRNASLLTVKVAGEKDGVRCCLDPEVEMQLAAYLAEIKDAGVRINLVNREADTFNCSIDIYYNPMLLPENVRRDCEAAIRSYIANLPFNGEYTNMALIDALQAVEGVRIAEFRQATASASGMTAVTAIDARHVPAAGYFRAGQITLTMKAHEQV